MEGLPRSTPDPESPLGHVPPPTSLRRRSKGGVAALIVGALLVAGGGAWVAWQRLAPAPRDEAAPARPVPAPVMAEEDVVEAPPLASGEADARARTSLASLSTEPEWSAWLSEQDLLRRLVGAVSSLAEGETPRASLAFLAPKESFVVREEEGGIFVDPASYARYDAIGRVVGAMDMQEVARAYGTVRPLLERLHREGARPGQRFADALEKTFARILAVPLPGDDVELVSSGAVWAHADPALEALPAADRLLMRMGPQNLGVLQEKVRELRDALGSQ